MAKLLRALVLVRHEFKDECDDCETLLATPGSMIVVIDPYANSPTKSPLSEVSGKQSAKQLIKVLKSALKKWQTASKKRGGKN